MINSILQLKNLRLRDVKWLPQCHTASKWCSQDWNWGVSDFEARTPSPPPREYLAPSILYLATYQQGHSRPSLKLGVHPTTLSRCLFRWGRISLPSVSIAALDTEDCLGEIWLPSSPVPHLCPLLPNPGPFPPVKGRHLLTPICSLLKCEWDF